jgi:glycine betaine/proline transport system permease protein
MFLSVSQSASKSVLARDPGRYMFLGALIVSLCFAWKGESFLPKWSTNYPVAWTPDIQGYVAKAMYWLVDEAAIGPLVFSDITRGAALLIDVPMQLLRKLLVSGFSEGSGASVSQLFPQLPWSFGFAISVWAGYRIGGIRLAALFLLCLGYIVVFGYWESAMLTMASIILAVPLGIVGGIFWGIAAFRRRTVESATIPILDLMQTIPTFAYLVPVLFLVGFGPAAAIIATIVYAMPPMVRITLLSLKGVPVDIVELGRMTGCTDRQLLWKILLPSTISGLLVGANQVIMLSLNMVIIASMIGAGGLGYDVLISLRRLDVGKGLEAGMAIVLLAIALDRLGQAIANRPEPSHSRSEDKRRRTVRDLLTWAAALAAAYGAGHYFPAIQSWPTEWTVSTTEFWQQVIRWMTINLFDTFDAIKNILLLNIMIPFKRFLLLQPWPWVLLLLSVAGWRLGGVRLAVISAGLAVFILLGGLWDKAIITIYLCGIAVLLSALIGIPVGILAAGRPVASRAIQAVIDTLQTLPTFVYLIPVIMLLGVGDVSAIVAVVAYAVAPAIRYTVYGLEGIERHHIEAGLVSGCSYWQLLWKVRMPMAGPSILLGVNQTVMMAISMLVITALVGTRDLGQEVFMALSRAEPGKGIVAGLGIAAISIIADRLIMAKAMTLQGKLASN